MNCITCGDDAGIHRAVLEIDGDRVLGGLCEECDADLLGERHTAADGGDPAACEFGGHRGELAAPRIELAVEDERGRPEYVEYRLTAGTPRLCEHHLRDMRPDATGIAVEGD